MKTYISDIDTASWQQTAWEDMIAEVRILMILRAFFMKIFLVGRLDIEPRHEPNHVVLHFYYFASSRRMMYELRIRIEESARQRNNPHLK